MIQEFGYFSEIEVPYTNFDGEVEKWSWLMINLRKSRIWKINRENLGEWKMTRAELELITSSLLHKTYPLIVSCNVSYDCNLWFTNIIYLYKTINFVIDNQHFNPKLNLHLGYHLKALRITRENIPCYFSIWK